MSEEPDYWDRIAADIEEEKATYQRAYGWRDWVSLATEAGEVRYRRTGGGEDPNYEKGQIEIAFGDHVWKGRFSGCVDGSAYYSVAGISVSYSPYIELVGQDHAEGDDAFVAFAAPHLIRGTRPVRDIGKVAE